MAPAPFDTQKFVETLTASGLPEAQSKAISSAFREATDADLATKSDLRELRNELKTDMIKLRSEFKTDMLELRNELKTDILALRNGLDKLRDEFRLDMHQLELRMTLKLDAAMVIMIGATAAIVKL
jgi:hypothetical protein